MRTLSLLFHWLPRILIAVEVEELNQPRIGLKADGELRAMVKKYVTGLWAVMLWMFAGVVSAQTTTSTSTATTTPGVPNTGAGDVVMNAVVLGIAAIACVGTAAYLYYARNA